MSDGIRLSETHSKRTDGPDGMDGTTDGEKNILLGESTDGPEKRLHFN